MNSASRDIEHYSRFYGNNISSIKLSKPANNCPMNIGGEWGYYEYLEILKDKTHEEYEYMKNLSQSYYSGRFDIKSVNKMLK